MDIVALDFETAAGRDSACSVGIFKFGDSGTVSEHYLINPEIEDDQWDPFAISIHGIKPEMVKSSPNFEEVWTKIELISNNSILVAHNAAFDMSVIRYSLKRYNLKPKPFKYLCSAKISKKVWPELPTTRLDYLAELFNIEFEHHNALEDAKTCAAIFVESLSKFYKNMDIEINVEKFMSELGLQIGFIDSDLSYLPCGANSRSSSAINPVKGIYYQTDPTKKIDESNPLFNSHIVFTGTLISMNRKEAWLRVKDMGAIPQENVNQQTNFLVAGEQDLSKFKPGSKVSSKMLKAIELSKSGKNIEIVGESEFLKMLGI